jgi:hypothetical protein
LGREEYHKSLHPFATILQVCTFVESFLEMVANNVVEIGGFSQYGTMHNVFSYRRFQDLHLIQYRFGLALKVYKETIKVNNYELWMCSIE